MSPWTHSICARCWNDRQTDPFEPERDGQGALERCCWCGYMHCTGIYLRESPESAELAWCRARLPGHAHRADEQAPDAPAPEWEQRTLRNERIRDRSVAAMRGAREHIARCAELGRPLDDAGARSAYETFVADAIHKAIETELQRARRAAR